MLLVVPADKDHKVSETVTEYSASHLVRLRSERWRLIWFLPACVADTVL
jgi:hypothetical protein